MNRNSTVAFGVTVGFILGMALGLAFLIGVMFGKQGGLPACEFEDSTNCYWDAEKSGNGIGVSFIDWNGKTYYPKETP